MTGAKNVQLNSTGMSSLHINITEVIDHFLISFHLSSMKSNHSINQSLEVMSSNYQSVPHVKMKYENTMKTVLTTLTDYLTHNLS